MPVDLSSLLSLDATDREVAIPVGAETVHVTIRELPYGVSRRLSLRYLGASQAYEACRASVERMGEAGALPLTSPEADALAGALAALYEAQREAVRWGVTGHREGDFLLGGLPVPFESEEATFNGTPYRVASPRMLRLYQLAGGGRAGDAGALLPDLASAVFAAQRPDALGGASASPLPGSSE
jgi:hypothetical protein